MELIDAIKARHSVRSYADKPIEKEKADALNALIAECNEEGNLKIQLVLDEPRAFGGAMAKYGSFSGVKNYIVLLGKKDKDLDEKCGYYGEKIVLLAQTLGLNSCWVGLSYSKGKCPVEILGGDKIVCVIALGYGLSQGVPHKSKPYEVVALTETTPPEWFRQGVDAALLAPTAMNQQRFLFTLRGNSVEARAALGFYAKVDLGIAKLHFEIGAGKDNFEWK